VIFCNYNELRYFNFCDFAINMKKTLITVSLIATMASHTIIGSPLAASAQKKFNGLDQNCKPAPTADEEWTIEKTFQFSDQGKNYKLVLSKTIDGSGSICLLQGKSSRPMGLKYWESEFIDGVDQLSSKIFTFQIHEGNGNPTPTKKYRLNLTQPQNPKITLLKKWIIP
jgi:hypothetical protein